LTLLTALACGGRADVSGSGAHAGEAGTTRGGSGGAGGSSLGIAGLGSAGTANSGAGTAGSTTGIGGASTTAGGIGAASNGTAGGPDGTGIGAQWGGPPSNTAEAAVLAPLSAAASAFDVSGKELIDWVWRVGFARGYAMCRCSGLELGFREVAGVTGCAEAESGIEVLTDAHGKRCAAELTATQPELEAALRCYGRDLQVDGLAWLATCGKLPRVRQPPSCPPGLDAFIACHGAYYCEGEAALKSDARCDGKYDCTDRADEAGCYEEHGQDQLLCGGLPYRPGSFCSETSCGAALGALRCDREVSTTDFLCPDGQKLASSAVCDRVEHRRDGADEAPCLR
jgi:hypothetical protein